MNPHICRAQQPHCSGSLAAGRTLCLDPGQRGSHHAVSALAPSTVSLTMPQCFAASYAINLTLIPCAPRRNLPPWPSWRHAWPLECPAVLAPSSLCAGASPLLHGHALVVDSDPLAGWEARADALLGLPILANVKGIHLLAATLLPHLQDRTLERPEGYAGHGCTMGDLPLPAAAFCPTCRTNCKA